LFNGIYDIDDKRNDNDDNNNMSSEIQSFGQTHDNKRGRKRKKAVDKDEEDVFYIHFIKFII